MNFCPNCGTKLVLLLDEQNTNTSLKLRCPKCSFTQNNSRAPQVTTTVTPTGPEEAIVVLGEEAQELRTMSTMRAECPKCQNHRAYVWQVQTRSGDEGPTQFFRCTACSHTWRLYT